MGIKNLKAWSKTAKAKTIGQGNYVVGDLISVSVEEATELLETT